MESQHLWMALLGGALIGAASSLLLLLKGRIFGVSGIIAGVLMPKQGDIAWRISMILGLLAAGLIFVLTAPELLVGTPPGSLTRYLIAGLLVGFGTRLGGGCTSGHGVCGVSRLSPRSILATITFILIGMLVVAAMRTMGGSI